MNNQTLIDNIKELYKAGDIEEIIKRNVFLFTNCLELGYNTKELYQRTHDLGIKPNEMGISLAVSLNRIDNTKLNETDVKIKEKLNNDLGKEIKEWSEVLKD